MPDGEMLPTQHVLRLPELGLSHVPLVASLWLVARGSQVTEGDRVLEVLAGDVTVDLAAPASGRLTAKLVDDDDPITVGQALAIIEMPAPEA
jgi:pyruvate/2-oxoglutarate dehydrogenase complex dihydrolipoamide acyltransferase (E2) component